MDISTGSWFKYLREEVLTEGLRDIGLPEPIVDFIEDAMPDAPEKSKMYVGNRWKERTLTSRSQAIAGQSWENFIERNFKDQVQVQSPSGESDEEARASVGKSQMIARTMTPYYVGGVDGKPVVRKIYDDETVKQNERIVLIALNVRNAFSKPAGTWRKVFMKAVKALSKAGLPSEKVEVVKDELARINMYKFRDWWNEYDLLFAWLNDEATNYDVIKDEEDINEAFNIAKEDLQGSEKPDQIIHQFEDGFYWYNLEKSNCPVEGERMNHCGTDGRGTLVSLRKAKTPEEEAELSVSDRRRLGTSNSFITMTVEGSTIYQIKGSGNNAPEADFWKYLDWFIDSQDIEYVGETGEHSSDDYGFQEMNKHLQSEHPDVEFAGVLNIEEMQEAVDRAAGNHEGDYTSIEVEIQDPDEYGADHQDATNAYVNLTFDLEIDLGWSDIVLQGDLLYPAIEKGSDIADDMYDGIPEDSNGSLAVQFEEEIGLDDIAYEMPGEDYHISFEVAMRTGVTPGWEIGDPEVPKTAHLLVSIRTTDIVDAYNPDQIYDEVVDLSSTLKKEFEDKWLEYTEKVRSEMVDAKYVVRNAYDKTLASLLGKKFNHWIGVQDSSAVEFAWSGLGSASKNVINDGGQIPMIVQMYGLAFDRNIGETYSKTFGSALTGRPPRLENPDLNRNMARNLEKLYRAKSSNPNQQQLNFGPGYTGRPPMILLAEDSHFIIQGTNSVVQQGGRYATQPIEWLYKIQMNSRTAPDEIEITQEILDYFDENPEMVQQAALQTIQDAQGGILALAQARKDDIESGRQPYAQIRRIESMMGAQVEANHLAMKGMMIATWINQNFEQMDEVEKYVSYYKYLRPIVNQQIARIGPIQTDGDDAGKPDYFDQEVRTQLIKMGATSSQAQSRRQDPISGRMGAPRPAQESMEEQISRIDNMLNEIIEVRRYRINIELILETGPETPIEDYKDVIRGCKGVTTVNTIRSETRMDRTTAIFGIKYVLKAQESRRIYLRQVFIPYINGIVGLSIGPGGISNPEQITKLREGSVISTYPLSSYGTVPQSSRKFPTPRLSIDKVVSDWMEGGVMAYDTPMDANNMRYHVMVPTSELRQHIGSHYRSDATMFHGRYKNFIKNGPMQPVYVAIGQNGRCKITGNEDDVWFASKSGLEELPVFFSYQKQV